MTTELDLQEINASVEAESVFVDRLLGQVRQVIVGQTNLLERLLMGILTQGHMRRRSSRFVGHTHPSRQDGAS